MIFLSRLALGLAICVMPAVAMAAECSETAARPEVGKPLQAAAKELKEHRIKQASEELKRAEAVPNKCPYESFVIEQMRAAVASAAGDTAAAIHAHEALLNSGHLSQAEQLRSLQALGALSYQAKDYPKAISWTNKYFQAGGNDVQMKTVLAQSYYLAGDCNNAIKVQNEEIQAEVKADKTPSESELQLLAACYSQLKDSANLFKAREQLLTYYPTKEHWADLIKSVANKPGFSDRLGVDIARLDFALGTLSSEPKYIEDTQLALVAGSSGEAKRILDKGFATKVVGVGQGADRANRLKKLVDDTAAKDQAQIPQRIEDAKSTKNGDAEVAAAFAYVGFGQPDKAIPVIEQALATDTFKHKEEAKLHLALAYIEAGQQAKATSILQTVGGTDGTADLARLWLVALKQNPKLKLFP